MYMFHAKNPNAHNQLHMRHSLVHQLIRQDPMMYRYAVTLNGDHNWQLISFPTLINERAPKDTGGETLSRYAA